MHTVMNAMRLPALLAYRGSVATVHPGYFSFVAGYGAIDRHNCQCGTLLPDVGLGACMRWAIG